MRSLLASIVFIVFSQNVFAARVCTTPLHVSSEGGFTVVVDDNGAQLYANNIAGLELLAGLPCKSQPVNSYATDSMETVLRCELPLQDSTHAGYIVKLTSADVTGVRYAIVLQKNIAGEEVLGQLNCR